MLGAKIGDLHAIDFNLFCNRLILLLITNEILLKAYKYRFSKCYGVSISDNNI